MKKIKSINQLRDEKKLIKQRQLALEHKIQVNWTELKESLKPANLAKDAIKGMLRKKAPANTKDGGVIKSSLSQGIVLLAGKLAETAGEKFRNIFKRKDASNGQLNKSD